MAQYTETQENKTGADCSGSSGDSNRVLTLANTGETRQPGFIVYASGLALKITDEYTVVHATTETKITFLNPLWDDMTVIVCYFQYVNLSIHDTIRLDFQSIITEQGISATLIRPSETTASMGEVTAYNGTNYTIATIFQDITKKDRQIHEMGLAVPGNIKAYFYHEYPNSITGNGTVSVQVGDIIEESDNKQWKVEQILGERHFSGQEIFRVGVLKNINLEE